MLKELREKSEASISGFKALLESNEEVDITHMNILELEN